MKSVLISIQPKWVEKITSGEKTIEVRKSKPKLDTPFKCYIYCTNSGGTLHTAYNGLYYHKSYVGKSDFSCINGKVIGEFVCDKIYKFAGRWFGDYTRPFGTEAMILRESCLTLDELTNYLSLKDGYGWHISNLKIYDKPKELSEFIKPFKYDGDGLRCCTKEELEDIYEWDCETLFKNKYPNFDFENCKCEDCPKAKDFYRLKLAPQSWCYVGSGV